MSTVIQNCFPKCGLDTEDSVGMGEENQHNSDWVELQGKMDCPASKFTVKNWIITYVIHSSCFWPLALKINEVFLYSYNNKWNIPSFIKNLSKDSKYKC